MSQRKRKEAPGAATPEASDNQICVPHQNRLAAEQCSTKRPEDRSEAAPGVGSLVFLEDNLPNPSPAHPPKPRARAGFDRAKAHAYLTKIAQNFPERPTADGPRAAFDKAERFALQSAFRGLGISAQDASGRPHPTALCFRTHMHGADRAYVPVAYSKAQKRASYTSLKRCGLVWACPVCSAAISERRRIEMQAYQAAHKAAGGSLVLLTRTFPHKATDDPVDLLKRLSKAEGLFKSSGAYTRFATRWGIVGTIRGKETTIGASGFHPHTHDLLFTRKLDASELPLIEDEAFSLWVSACRRAGLPEPSRHAGVDARGGDHAAQYIAKWGTAEEITKAHAKRGRGGNLTPFDLLRVALYAASDKKATRFAKAFYAEYLAAFKGARQLVISPSLKAVYGVNDAEMTDEEAANAEPDDLEVLGRLTRRGWQIVCGPRAERDRRGALLAAVGAAGTYESLAAYVHGLAPYTPLDELLAPPESPMSAEEMAALYARLDASGVDPETGF